MFDKTQQFPKVWHLLSTLDFRDRKIVCIIKATKDSEKKEAISMFYLSFSIKTLTKMSVLADDLLLSKQI